MNKKGVASFMLLNIASLAMKAATFLVIIMIGVGLWHVFNPSKAEASSKKAFEDIVLKVRSLESGQTLISAGYLDKDIRLRGINSEQRLGNVRPPQCGAVSNSCICICKDDSCTKVLECKGFSESKIASITYNNGELEVKGEKDLTVKLTLEGKTLKIEDVHQN
jgi:hypothetical protein